MLAFLVGVFLGAADTLGAGFLHLAFFLVHVTGAFLGASVTSVGVGLGGERVGPWQHDRLKAGVSSHLRGSADCWGRVGAVRTSPEVAPLLITGPAGARLARAALASFHFPQPR